MMRIADDFGLGRKHDDVILSLLAAKKIDGTSVMVNAAISPEAIDRLKYLRQRGALVGLHLNLTQPLPGTREPHSLLQLLLPLRRRALRQQVADNLNRQVSEFVQLFGSLPDYYDGHQHCQCFPNVIAVATQLPKKNGMWMRVPLPNKIYGRWLNFRAGGMKTILVMCLAAFAKTKFIKAGWSINEDFSGFLKLDDPEQVSAWLPRLLKSAGSDTVVMLHPGAVSDPIQCAGHAPQSRANEAEILMDGQNQ